MKPSVTVRPLESAPRRRLTGSLDGTVKIWTAASEKEVLAASRLAAMHQASAREQRGVPPPVIAAPPVEVRPQPESRKRPAGGSQSAR